jgi:hypothetical protein
LKIVERYASAVRSSNLRSIERTTISDSDVIGAVGLASKTDYLGALLLRFELGDNRAARECAGVMAHRAHVHFPKLHPRTAVDLASALLAFTRSDVCPDCNGLGREVIAGTPTLGTKECKTCGGTGKKRIDRQFAKEHMPVVDWMYHWVSRAKHEAAHIAAEKVGCDIY